MTRATAFERKPGARALGAAGLVLWGALASMATAAAVQPSPSALEALTVPADRLPGGCRLKPPPEPPPAPAGTGSRVVVGSPQPVQNPWVGDERRTVAMIHSRLDETPRVPDGPPLDSRRATQFALKWADGVVGAYRATYVSDDLTEIAVYAVRLDNGSLKVRVFTRDDADRCVQAVRTHVRSVK